MSSSALLAL